MVLGVLVWTRENFTDLTAVLMHALHCSAESLAANLPLSHWSHAAALAPLYFPARHGLHDVDPATASNMPATHASQYVMPLALWILPASHAAQCALDVCGLVNVPY
jgi:hypothetical protein